MDNPFGGVRAFPPNPFILPEQLVGAGGGPPVNNNQNNNGQQQQQQQHPPRRAATATTTTTTIHNQNSRQILSWQRVSLNPSSVVPPPRSGAASVVVRGKLYM
jgi:hypothetical protein